LPWHTHQNLINLGRNLLELIYPTYCGGGCGRQGTSLCLSCTSGFIPIEPANACPLCGRWVGKPLICGNCIADPPRFTAGFFGYSFEGAMREALHAFKFQGRKDVGRALMASLDQKIASFSQSIDTIIPLPVTEKRLKERGFNQSYIISEAISRISGKPMDYRTLVKVRETEDQYKLSRQERRKNIKGAFAAIIGKENYIRSKTVLLVDDLYTTGNTAWEACKVLQSLKPKEIVYFALARTP
jgi:competence protein ComFC